jgi:tetratricopeptide (TPR) repeat protein
MKKVIFLPLLFAFFAPLFAQSQSAVIPWWLSFEYGKQQFRAGDYGAALMLFEDARRDRRAMYEQMERDLIYLMSQNEVRRIGDSLDRVERYSRDRLYKAASAAFDELYYRIPKSSFENSAQAALSAFNKLKDYPEAEYWIGEVYSVEGELPLALSQYRKAYSIYNGNSSLYTTEDSWFSVTLQYKIAGIHDTRQEYTEMIKVYESIINDLDNLWVNSNRPVVNNSNNGSQSAPIPYEQAYASFERSAMTKTLTEHGINRFLELYRYNNNAVEKAHRLLGYYYAVRGRPSAEPHLMFAFLIQNTIIMEEIKRHHYDFSFTTQKEVRENHIHSLSELTQFINKNALLAAYIEEVEYYKTAYYFSLSLYRNGKASVARSLWEFLASVPQAGEWYSRALNQLRSPHFEPIVEMGNF